MTIRCGICGAEFVTEAELQVHTHDAGATASEDLLACPLCGDRFEREEQLVVHQGTDHVGVDALDQDRAVP